MKEGWKIRKLGEITSFVGDGDWIESKDQSPGGIRLIQTGNIGGGIYKDKGERAKYISPETFYRLHCTEIFAGDCLVSRLPDPIGRACILPKLNERTITAVDCSIIRFKPTFLPQLFVYYSLSNRYQSYINTNATGTTRKRISRKRLEQAPIPIPPIHEQERIVAELDCLTGIIEKKKQQLEELAKLARSIFYEMFGDPITNEKGWKVKKLGDEFGIASGGTPSTKENAYWENGTISWIGSNMCHNEVIYENDGKFITEAGLSNSSARLFRKGSVLVALVGATIGKVALIEFDTTTNQNIAVIDVPANKGFTSFFVFYLIQSLYCLFESIGEGKFKMANLSFVRSLPLIAPPTDLQERFAQKIEAIEKQKELVKQSIVETETLFNSRMDYWFN